MISRRSFFKRAGLATAAAGASALPDSLAAGVAAARPGQKPRNIIHIVSDGMSHGTLTCSEYFSHQIRQRGLAWTELLRNSNVTRGMANPRSLNSIVTDSAAASSAWGSGSRVENGALNALPDGRVLTPLYTLFGQKGWARGLVTTAEITHATPAGFAASTASREDADGIAAQYLESRIEVLLGGGRRCFDPAKRKDKRDLRDEFGWAGYAVAQSAADLETATAGKLLGIFADGHLPYTIDRNASDKIKAAVPKLATMVREALKRLSAAGSFILQVEGARVDHAAHNSDAAAAFREQIALDEAIEVCLEFQKQSPDTLIIICTDHGNSNPGVNGVGWSYELSSYRFTALAEVRQSFPEIIKRVQAAGQKIDLTELPPDREDALPQEKEVEAAAKLAGNILVPPVRIEPKQLNEIIADSTGYRMSDRRGALLAKAFAWELPNLYDQMNATVTQLGQALANRIGIGWNGNTHTADFVPIMALGPGAERFTGLMNNTDVFGHYTQLAGIDFKNPSLPIIADRGDDPRDVENAGHRSAATSADDWT